MNNSIRKPSVLIPYPGPCRDPHFRDVYLYLRPESNGYKAESILLGVIEKNEYYRTHNELIYLANMPGSFIIQNKIIEKHYEIKLFFAVAGKKAFTFAMQKKFEAFFQIPFSEAKIVGAFEALEILGINYDQLFKLWVEPQDMLLLNGQTVKKRKNLFIINYDIPSLLHRNNNQTDIAVMILRSALSLKDFFGMIEEMTHCLIREKVLDPKQPPSRVFHFSKGPMQEIQDGIGYLYNAESMLLPLDQISFFRYLLEKGITQEQILGFIHKPILWVEDTEGRQREESIYDLTIDNSYEDAGKKLEKAVFQYFLR